MNNDVHVCHCSICRIHTSGVVMTLDIQQSLIFIKDQNLSVYSSSDWAERGFCN